MKVLFSSKGVSNDFLAPYYLSGLIFTPFPFGLHVKYASGVLFCLECPSPGQLHGELPYFSQISAQMPRSSAIALPPPPRYSVSLPSCIFPYSTALITTCQTAHLTFLESGYFTSCVVTRMEHRGHSRYWGTICTKGGHKYFNIPP